MIIIPEKELVLITPPRTGSTSLSDQIAKNYPMSFRPYRHMEADGIPFGYDRWRRVGVFREPVARLWSVYHYCKSVAISDRGTPAWREKLLRSVSAPFEEWLIENPIVFTDPFDSAGTRYYPRYAVRSPVPENRKSLFMYLRPDLGTEIMELNDLMLLLDLDPSERKNSSSCPAAPRYSDLPLPAREHFYTFFDWDFRRHFGGTTRTRIGGEP
ncbi:hypothetical protein GB927_012740 [Shinella sp. CPCC 100929]|uniref:Sulfotransferase family protein n=1 Tax=Shinella lacus TaxID=2654216 RepID=A0ABT1R6U7_9HYPH|nr:hypothetical protein [Shinella lacus]MCQ4630912.1 hypothetical protein [Shinella lacus]